MPSQRSFTARFPRNKLVLACMDVAFKPTTTTVAVPVQFKRRARIDNPWTTVRATSVVCFSEDGGPHFLRLPSAEIQIIATERLITVSL